MFWPRSVSLMGFLGAISVLLIAVSVRAHLTSGVHVRELKRTGNTVTIEITLPSPKFDTVQKTLHLHRISGQIQTGDVLASVAIPLRVSRRASVTLLSHDDANVTASKLDLTSALTQDIASDGKRGASVHRTKPPTVQHHGIGFASLAFMGTMRAADLSRLEVGILDKTGPSSVRAAKKIILQITDPAGLSSLPITDVSEPFKVSNGVFKSRLAASRSVGKGMQTLSVNDAQQLPGIQSDDGNVYRMYVRQDGIYHITFSDLQNFGIDPTQINPATLRVINKGQQVAVYVSDIYQDGTFHTDDYFEFFGNQELYNGRDTLGDFYYDPDTKNNIYFLVWGSHYSPIPVTGVKRMAEESGEIRTANRSPYPRDSFYVDLKDSSFLTKIHFEQDNVSDPLDVTDIDQRSDLRDHWFFGIVGTGTSDYLSTYSTQTVVPFPDVRQNRPVSFRVALHGIDDYVQGATDDKGNPLPFVDSEEDAMISVNGQFALHGIWSGQNLKFLSTDTASQVVSTITAAGLFGSQDSSGGIQPINITVAQQKQTTVVGCRFGFNWIEIGYDRMYYAYQDSITFRAPQYSTAGLYQFTLQNFDRTDIAIYRKGVSKISNVVFVSNPNQLRSTQAIFQVNIASAADEFIAVTDSAMLKPYKYQKDNFAGLASPSNSGDYIIITNSDHLPKGNNNAHVPLQDLLSYRASTNHVSTQLIDVANIYDEFHYGSPSANAIKAFLTYAYNNWQDPPKYVLLVGVTHEGTDDPEVYFPNDQVPAPYIQAYLEGDVAADAWYSMLDSADLVPDLILGRLATPDINGDAAYIAKLKQFEADPAKPGDWKDRALFIGAGGGFDLDIDGILENNLPERVSVIRQSTVPASPYHGTPETLFDNVNGGLGMMAYFGHGGAAIWDDPINDTSGPPFLTNSQVGGFTNNARYPLVLSMTCFTATYDGSSEGILNSLQNIASAGTIAALGTTSFGWEQNDAHLAQAVVPRVTDSIGGSIAERIIDAKMDFLSQSLPGDLIPPTLVYCYHFLGDPLLSPVYPTDRAALTLSSRVIQPGGTVQLTGTSSIQNGVAHIELADNMLSPLAPPHIVDNIPVTNGAFSLTDNVPTVTIPYATYRAIVYDKSTNHFAATAEDVTITESRITELDFEPHPLPIGVPLDFSAAIQTPQPITSVTANITIYSQSPNGTITALPLAPMAMTLVSDRYHVVIPASSLSAGNKIVATITLLAGTDNITSDSMYIVVGAASDPSAVKDIYHRTLTGKYVSTKSGLAWNEFVYNWGSSPLNMATASLLNVRNGVPVLFGSTSVSEISSHGDTMASVPLSITSLDSATLEFAVSPETGTSPLNLRDSTTTNDTTLSIGFAPGAVAYQAALGTTLDGQTFSPAYFNNDEVILSLPPSSEGNVSADVIGVVRQYTSAQTAQPDIHFLNMYTDKGVRYSSLRITSDSLGAMALTNSQRTATLSVKLNLNDSLIKLHPNDSLFIYRLDDRSKLWTILATSRPTPNQLTAVITNLGTFAIAYNTDRIPPIVDITVEGQVFINNGEVPPQPKLDAIIQDADGIDITPGKTIVKIDNRVLPASQYTMLDSSRTMTTVNLTMQPSLSSGTHSITIQATDNDGRTNAPPKELDVHVSNQFGVIVLGSFPNPFTGVQMFIAYQISGIAYAQSVSLDIYTVSGRRIRTMSYPSTDPTRTFGFLQGGTGTPTSIGYHEVWWNGLDDGGSEVANGVYFYRLTVNTTNSTQEVKGKFARLR
jgi:Peptidase family C25